MNMTQSLTAGEDISCTTAKSYILSVCALEVTIKSNSLSNRLTESESFRIPFLIIIILYLILLSLHFNICKLLKAKITPTQRCLRGQKLYSLCDRPTNFVT